MLGCLFPCCFLLTDITEVEVSGREVVSIGVAADSAAVVLAEEASAEGEAVSEEVAHRGAGEKLI